MKAEETASFTVGEGRPVFLTKLAVSLADMGQPRDWVLEKVLAANAAQCRPVLPHGEVERLVAAVFAPQRLPEHTLPFVTAEDLANALESQPSYVQEPYLVSGASTLLSAKVKTGKTTLALAMIKAIRAGAPLLGFPPGKRGPVILLTEQGRQSLREALRRAGLLDDRDLHILFWNQVATKPWSEVVAQVVKKAAELEAVALVVDTIHQWSGLTGDQENSSGSTLEAVKPLQLAAATGLSVLIVAHDRKSGGEVGDTARGSSALPGAVDIVLSLRRVKGLPSSVRKIEAISRFDDTPAELTIELTDDGFISRDSSRASAEDKAALVLLKILPSDERGSIDMDALQEQLKPQGISRTSIQGALTTLAAEGKCCRKGEGKRNKPFLYWRGPRVPDLVSVAALPLGSGVPAETPDPTRPSEAFLPEAVRHKPAESAESHDEVPGTKSDDGKPRTRKPQ